MPVASRSLPWFALCLACTTAGATGTTAPAGNENVSTGGRDDGLPDGDDTRSPDAGLSTAPEECRSVTITDPALEAAVREYLRLPSGPLPISAHDILSLSATGVSSVSGLECFTELRFLRLRDGRASDLSPLAGLTALEDIDISGHPVDDLSALAGATKLETLSVIDAPLADIAPLSGLLALRSLTLRNTQVADLTPLAALPLEWLELSGAPVTSIAPLATVTSLAHIGLSRTLVTDLSPLHFPPRESMYCAEIHALELPLDANTLDNVIPALCNVGWPVQWSLPGEPRQICGLLCR